MTGRRGLAALLARCGCAVEPEEIGGATAVVLDEAHLRPLDVAGESLGPLVGAAWLRPVPGLPGLAGIWFAVDPSRRRRGHGGRLLSALEARAVAAGFTAFSAPVAALDDPEARFLLAHGFAVEHVEVRLRLSDLSSLPAAALPPGFSLRTYADPSQAIGHFLRLHDAAFGPHPWHQPYAGPAEVRAELASTGGQAADLLFLTHGGGPVGFAWLRRPAPGAGEIEPIALLPEAHGRGWGRLLLLAAMERLRATGARDAHIACWQDNRAALGLYRSVGFLPVGETIFLARPLSAAGSPMNTA